MYHKPSSRWQIVKRVLTYSFMTLSVVLTVFFLTLFMLGYRFDSKGQIEQYALLQFSSTPSGANVTVDGNLIDSKTPNKAFVQPGMHTIQMWRSGYETWQKKVDVQLGIPTWLNYAILVPKSLPVESVSNYKSVYASLSSPDSNSMIIQQAASHPVFELVDLSSDNISTKSLTIPSNLYTASNDPKQAFKLDKWDDNGRYVLVSHNYNSQTEWLVLDSQDASSTKNISRLFDTPVSDFEFADNSGNNFYVLNNTDIRKLNFSAGTISQPIVGNVSSFEVYSKSNIITWVGNGAKAGQRTVGIYRDGDSGPSTMRTVTSSLNVPLHIATVHYFNEDYVVISEGKKVDILKGSYPNTTSDNSSTMPRIATFDNKFNVDKLGFSPDGQYVIVQSGNSFGTYDLEYQNYSASTVQGKSAAFSLKWLDKNYLWSDRDGHLVIREFDGTNVHTINDVTTGQDAALINNGRYLYSINSNKDGFQLQRVRMILP